MEFSDKIIDKKEELLDEFQNLTLDELAIKIKQISTRARSFATISYRSNLPVHTTGG
ncbi:MAG: hypothetical protein HN597_04095 [Desulfobacula sp.]|nr:hypothetical protein [Desulfobacula sp.]